MLAIIAKENEIKKAQTQLWKMMKEEAEKHGVISLGGKGWHRRREVHWNSSLGIWRTMKEEQDRYWNSFGTGEPRWNTKYPHTFLAKIKK